jgi:plastocyanin
MSCRSSLRSPFALLVVLLAAVAVLASACGGDASGSADVASDDVADEAPASDGPTVLIRSSTFSPDKITVAAGDTVTWVFRDKSLSHNVVGDGYKSPLQRGGRYTHTFDEPGTHSYRCTLHPAMKGKVEVTE